MSPTLCPDKVLVLTRRRSDRRRAATLSANAAAFGESMGEPTKAWAPEWKSFKASSSSVGMVKATCVTTWAGVAAAGTWAKLAGERAVKIAKTATNEGRFLVIWLPRGLPWGKGKKEFMRASLSRINCYGRLSERFLAVYASVSFVSFHELSPQIF